MDEERILDMTIIETLQKISVPVSSYLGLIMTYVMDTKVKSSTITTKSRLQTIQNTLITSHVNV